MHAQTAQPSLCNNRRKLVPEMPRNNQNPRGPNPTVKQLSVVYAAVVSGCQTSFEVALACSISTAIAARRLLDLEVDGLIERVGTQPRDGKAGRRVILWRVKSES